MRRSLVAVHTLLAMDNGSFISLLDPPASAQAAVAECVSDGTFPVLIGDEGSSDVMLSSPIILYDHPAVAPESAGDLCDATEIDEILALRVMTLTDDEKAEARGTDRAGRGDHRPLSTTCRPRSGRACTARCVAPRRPPEERDASPWWEPASTPVDPFTDTMSIDGVEVGTGTTCVYDPHAARRRPRSCSTTASPRR